MPQGYLKTLLIIFFLFPISNVIGQKHLEHDWLEKIKEVDRNSTYYNVEYSNAAPLDQVRIRKTLDAKEGAELLKIYENRKALQVLVPSDLAPEDIEYMLGKAGVRVRKGSDHRRAGKRNKEGKDRVSEQERRKIKAIQQKKKLEKMQLEKDK